MCEHCVQAQMSMTCIAVFCFVETTSRHYGQVVMAQIQSICALVCDVGLEAQSKFCG